MNLYNERYFNAPYNMPNAYGGVGLTFIEDRNPTSRSSDPINQVLPGLNQSMVKLTQGTRDQYQPLEERFFFRRAALPEQELGLQQFDGGNYRPVTNKEDFLHKEGARLVVVGNNFYYPPTNLFKFPNMSNLLSSVDEEIYDLMKQYIDSLEEPQRGAELKKWALKGYQKNMPGFHTFLSRYYMGDANLSSLDDDDDDDDDDRPETGTTAVTTVVPVATNHIATPLSQKKRKRTPTSAFPRRRDDDDDGDGGGTGRGSGGGTGRRLGGGLLRRASPGKSKTPTQQKNTFGAGRRVATFQSMESTKLTATRQAAKLNIFQGGGGMLGGANAHSTLSAQEAVRANAVNSETIAQIQAKYRLPIIYPPSPPSNPNDDDELSPDGIRLKNFIDFDTLMLEAKAASALKVRQDMEAMEGENEWIDDGKGDKKEILLTSDRMRTATYREETPHQYHYGPDEVNQTLLSFTTPGKGKKTGKAKKGREDTKVREDTGPVKEASPLVGRLKLMKESASTAVSAMLSSTWGAFQVPPTVRKQAKAKTPAEKIAAQKELDTPMHGSVERLDAKIGNIGEEGGGIGGEGESTLRAAMEGQIADPKDEISKALEPKIMALPGDAIRDEEGEKITRAEVHDRTRAFGRELIVIVQAAQGYRMRESEYLTRAYQHDIELYSGFIAIPENPDSKIGVKSINATRDYYSKMKAVKGHHLVMNDKLPLGVLGHNAFPPPLPQSAPPLSDEERHSKNAHELRGFQFSRSAFGVENGTDARIEETRNVMQGVRNPFGPTGLEKKFFRVSTQNTNHENPLYSKAPLDLTPELEKGLFEKAVFKETWSGVSSAQRLVYLDGIIKARVEHNNTLFLNISDPKNQKQMGQNMYEINHALNQANILMKQDPMLARSDQYFPGLIPLQMRIQPEFQNVISFDTLFSFYQKNSIKQGPQIVSGMNKNAAQLANFMFSLELQESFRHALLGDKYDAEGDSHFDKSFAWHLGKYVEQFPTEYQAYDYLENQYNLSKEIVTSFATELGGGSPFSETTRHIACRLNQAARLPQAAIPMEYMQHRENTFQERVRGNASVGDDAQERTSLRTPKRSKKGTEATTMTMRSKRK